MEKIERALAEEQAVLAGVLLPHSHTGHIHLAQAVGLPPPECRPR
jgi:hypothetical protein